MTSGAKAEGRFGKQDFVYVAEDDVDLCPAGERLSYRYTNEEDGKTLAPLLDDRLSGVCAEKQVHDGSGAPDLALGA